MEIIEVCSENKIKDCTCAYGDIYYHYEFRGEVTRGMHTYTVDKIGTGCMCHTPYYVELKYQVNSGEWFRAHIGSKEFERDYFKTVKEAWQAHVRYLDLEIIRWNKTVANLEQARKDAIRQQEDC